MQYATKEDIQDLLESLNITNDIEIQTKIFSLFACYLVSDTRTNSNLIITSHFVYDKIYIILNKGPPKKITVTLNFVSALLFDAEEDSCSTKRSLVLHAQLMLRVSGCLALMSNLFNSCMVHQETWSALCRCLSEVCRYSQENQNYCSDLISTGIRRCASGDTECYQVLQSLLHKHDQNTQQFIENNGLSIFTRVLTSWLVPLDTNFTKIIDHHRFSTYEINDFLQDIRPVREKLLNISCLKLVNAISQNPKAVMMLMHKTDVIEILKKFLDLYEKESQIGQWATIILYNIKTLNKDVDIHEAIETKTNGDYRLCVENLFNVQRLTTSSNKEKPKESKTNDYRFCINNENISNNHTDHGDTTELFQNVFREILQGQKYDVNGYNTLSKVSRNCDARQNAQKYLNTIGHSNRSSKIRSIPSIKMQFTETQGNSSKIVHLKNDRLFTSPNKNIFNDSRQSRGDLSFSFLLNDNTNRNKNTRNSQQFSIVSFNVTEKEKSSVYTNMSVYVRQDTKGNNEVTRNCYNATKLELEDNKYRTLEFKPTIVSTPKKFPAKHKLIRNYSIKNKMEERTITHDRLKHQKAPMKEIKNKSFSGKLFGAINESCTMLMKTVKNIFQTKNTDTATKREQSTMVNFRTGKAHSNYSFMDYMRRRDAIMGSQCGSLGSEKRSSGSCETCNDTILLKRKLEKDKKLKQTLKKLKFGINLYGCDFKKISATMWPRDAYMTPTVLYNLYRKLIVK